MFPVEQWSLCTNVYCTDESDVVIFYPFHVVSRKLFDLVRYACTKVHVYEFIIQDQCFDE